MGDSGALRQRQNRAQPLAYIRPQYGEAGGLDLRRASDDSSAWGATEKTKKKTKKTSEKCSGAQDTGSTGRRRGGASTRGLATSRAAGCTRQPQRPYQMRTAFGVGGCQAR